MRVQPGDLELELILDKSKRQVLRVLINNGNTALGLEELVDQYLNHNPEAQDTERVRIRFYHVILPQFVAAEVIDYDRRRNRIRYLGGDRIEHLLTVVENEMLIA